MQTNSFFKRKTYYNLMVGSYQGGKLSRWEIVEGGKLQGRILFYWLLGSKKIIDVLESILRDASQSLPSTPFIGTTVY